MVIDEGAFHSPLIFFLPIAAAKNEKYSLSQLFFIHKRKWLLIMSSEVVCQKNGRQIRHRSLQLLHSSSPMYPRGVGRLGQKALSNGA